tara:strand:+ start:491 stop:733 length:243 start_codon:yes stop_codon:yes gene_type:complete
MNTNNNNKLDKQSFETIKAYRLDNAMLKDKLDDCLKEVKECKEVIETQLELLTKLNKEKIYHEVKAQRSNTIWYKLGFTS